MSSSIPVAALYAAAARSDVIAAMRALYAAADATIAAHAAACLSSGECCRFGAYGHRLYVTALEVAYYLALGGDGQHVEAAPPSEVGSPRSLPVLGPSHDDACPHLSDGRCGARERRPLGCRIYYCEPAAQHWQGPLTEELLGSLRRLHDELDVPYFYADWMTIQRALQQHHIESEY